MNRHGIRNLATRRLCGLVAIVSLLVAGGCTKEPEKAPEGGPKPTVGTQVCIDATVAYYYRYKDAAPDQSDIAFIETLPPANRCVAVSTKKPPVYPDAAIAADVANGKMKIDKPLSPSAHISASVASIAVYYKVEGSPPTSQKLLAVEDLSNVQRDIVTASVFLPDGTSSPGCGSCPEFRCDGGTCCKRPPC